LEQEQAEMGIARVINRTAENALKIERKGGLLGIWAFWVTLGIRVFYTQKTDSDGRYAELFHIGHHDDYRIVKRKRPR